MPLRRRLMLVMAILLVIGLSVADLITYTSLRSFLYGRLDDQLAGAQKVAVEVLGHAARNDWTQQRWIDALDRSLSTEIYAAVVAPDGQLIDRQLAGVPRNLSPPPHLPRSVRLANGRTPPHGPYRPDPNDFNLSSATRPGVAVVAYRARAATVPQGTVITAVPLTSTDATLALLLQIEVAVSAAVLLVLCGVALWTVRRGLRPLDDMTATAGAIASGDLGRRIDRVDPSTEVGRLGAALNAMLAQIESGFAEKSASEDRLRQFVADASHELRTPLTSIRGYAELLRKGAFSGDEDRRRALTRVETEAARMGGLVDDLLLLARLDQGRPLDREPVDLRAVCMDAVQDARLADAGRTVTLVAHHPVMVAGDRDRLAQVAHNLVRNALSHTPPGSPVEVVVEAEGPMGVLRVVDHGGGLTARRREQVFDRFYRGSAARGREGTGLGLSIVRAIAEALGGRAWAEAGEDGGSLFVVQVPRSGSGDKPVRWAAGHGASALAGPLSAEPDGGPVGGSPPADSAEVSGDGRAAVGGRRAPG